MRASGFPGTHRSVHALGALLALVLVLGAADSGAAAERKKPPRATPGNSQSGKVYRWVDAQGVVHFGDQVPPEYAPIDREVLNQYGTAVATEQGVVTEGELAAERKADDEKKAARAAARRDEVLLSTYLSVEEIEALRNRRVELINGQISVTTNYLESLHNRLKHLQAEASGFKPYSKNPDAPQMDAKLAKELSDTTDAIALYEKTLRDTRTRQSRVVLAFDADIARFKELKVP